MKLGKEQKQLVEKLKSAYFLRGYHLIVWLMREGKTAPVVRFIDSMKTGDCLVICPPQVIPVWKAHIKDWSRNKNVDWRVTSDGILSSDDSPAVIRKRIGDHWDYIIIDEIHRFRYFSKRLKMLDWISRNAAMRLGLTGTPFDSNLAELYYPLQWLSDYTFFGTENERITNKQVFYQIYCQVANPGSKFPQYEIHPRVKDDFMKEVKEVSDIYKSGKVNPPTHEVVNYSLTPRQASMIDKVMNLEETGVDIIDDTLADMNTANIHDKVRQLYGGFYLHEGDIPYECSSLKWYEVAKLIQKLGGRRIVIWYRFRREGHYIIKTLPHLYKMDTFTQESLEKFNRDEIDILIAHPASAGAGVDISHADYSIFVTHSPKWTEVMQAFYRLAKYGDQNRKKIFHMVARHPLDQKSYEDMKQKEQATMDIYKEGVHGKDKI